MNTPRLAVAIVGMACRLPGGVVDPAGLWNLLVTGRDAVGPIPSSRAALGWPPGAVEAADWPGGYLDDIDGFDAAFFGFSDREARRIDPQQRLMLELAWHGLEDAGMDVLALATSHIGVFLGQWTSDFETCLLAGQSEGFDFNATTGCGRYATSGRISNLLGLTGPSLTIDAACSSSLVAVHLAAQAVASGECPMALAGGVNVILQRGIDAAYAKASILSASGQSRFGDVARDGYVRSEGAGLVVLKPLQAALDDGDRIHAVISGSAVNNDGGRAGLMGRPSPAGHATLLRAALANAGLEPGAVGYVEAHGTGTRAGDRVEIGALSAVYGQSRPTDAPLLVGALKTNIGHCEAASGVASLIKAVLVTSHGLVPPNLHLTHQDAAIQWDGCAVPQTNEPWPPGSAPRRAGITTFAISGTNCHMLIEQAPVTTAPLPTQQDHPAWLPLSARSSAAMRILAARYANLAEQGAALKDICWSAAVRRAALECRAVFPAASRTILLAALRSCADGAAFPIPAEPIPASWMAGGKVDWQQMIPRGAFIALPLMPWQRLSHWPGGSSTSTLATQTSVETTVLHLVGELLDIAPDDIDPARPLGEMGLTSLLATELSGRLAARFGLKLSATFAYDHPTLHALSAAIERQTRPEPKRVQTPPGLETLGDDQIKAQLLAELGGALDNPV